VRQSQLIHAPLPGFLRDREPRTPPSWPHIAVRRTPSLPPADDPAVRVFVSGRRKQDVDVRDKRGQDEGKWSSHGHKACFRFPATRVTPEFCTNITLEESEGAGNAGCWPHPQPCVRSRKAHKHSHHRLAETFRHSLRDGFNGFLRALPGDRAFLPPSPARSSIRKLDISVGIPGPHDFAVRFARRPSCAPKASIASRVPRS
jgi:hypothetical protein